MRPHERRKAIYCLCCGIRVAKANHGLRPFRICPRCHEARRKMNPNTVFDGRQENYDEYEAND